MTNFCKFSKETICVSKKPDQKECLFCILAGFNKDFRQLFTQVLWNTPMALGRALELRSLTEMVDYDFQRLTEFTAEYFPETVIKLESLTEILLKTAKKDPSVV